MNKRIQIHVKNIQVDDVVDGLLTGVYGINE